MEVVLQNVICLRYRTPLTDSIAHVDHGPADATNFAWDHAAWLQRLDILESRIPRAKTLRHWLRVRGSNLDDMVLAGLVVTIDALGCQTGVTFTIADTAGWYLLRVPTGAAPLAKLVHGHWGIENCPHWVLGDVALQHIDLNFLIIPRRDFWPRLIIRRLGKIVVRNLARLELIMTKCRCCHRPGFAAGQSGPHSGQQEYGTPTGKVQRVSYTHHRRSRTPLYLSVVVASLCFPKPKVGD